MTAQKVCVFNGFGVVPYECVDHSILLKRLHHMGIKDQRVLQIIKAMLKAGVMDNCEVSEEGTPQGGLISPLLANACLDIMDEWITGQWENKSTVFPYKQTHRHLCPPVGGEQRQGR